MQGCHPTTLGPGNMHISPDFIGSSREILEDTYGGTAIFLQGASGDVGPMISYSADPASADRNGRMLGYAACSAIESLLPPGTGIQYEGAIVSGATLAGWSETPVETTGAVSILRSEILSLDLPLAPQMSIDEIQQEYDSAEATAVAALAAEGEQSVAYRDARAISERWRRACGKQKSISRGNPDATHFTVYVTVMQLGQSFFVAMPGEPYQVVQQEIRARCAGLSIVLATLCNQSTELGYLLPADKVGQGTYQDELMFVKAGSLEMIIDRVSDKVLEWAAESHLRERTEALVDEEEALEVARL